MTKTTKNPCSLLLLSAVLFACLAFLPLHAKAATKTGNGVINLDTSASPQGIGEDTYSKADITGDGKKDTVKKTTWQSGGKWYAALYVNGKKIKTWNTTLPGINIVTVKKVSYLEISTEVSMGKTSCGLYQVKKGKLKKILDYSSLVNKKLLINNKFIYTGYAWDMMWVESVKGNTLTVNYSLGTKSLGQIKIRGLKMTYKSGKFTLSSKAANASASIMGENGLTTGTFTAKKKITVYKSAGSSKKSFTLKKNKKFTITKAVIKKKNIYVKVKTSAGKTGWLTLSTSSTPYVKARAIVIFG